MNFQSDVKLQQNPMDQTQGGYSYRGRNRSDRDSEVAYNGSNTQPLGISDTEIRNQIENQLKNQVKMLL
jgi:hypothetical protein